MKFGSRMEDHRFVKRLDLQFAGIILALIIIGLINLFSATHGADFEEFSSRFIRQLVWITVGWVLYFVVTFIDYDFFRRTAYVFYGLNIIALILVIVVGKEVNGSQRWISLGFFDYQPSETMKIGLILVLAKVLSARKIPIEGLGVRGLFLPAVIMGIPFVLTVQQPDLGTSLLYAAIAGTMVWFAKIKRSLIVFTLIAGVIAMPLVWSFGLKSYQRSRIITFLNPSKDTRGANYNSIQSKVAVGSGKFWGKGFRKGTQSQLEFLPERDTDFIYSVLSEEQGFFGSISTLAIFMFLFFRALAIAQQAKDRFGLFMVVGVSSLIFWHMFINIGMVTGILPIVGVPLPLLSYGGTIMMATMAGLGFISAVAYRRYLF